MFGIDRREAQRAILVGLDGWELAADDDRVEATELMTSTGVSPEMLSDRWYASHLREVSREECFELIASRPVGRVAYWVPSGPVVLPVNHVLDGEDLFRTSPHTELGRQMRKGTVAFEVDDYDEFNHSGWSVLARGSAEYDDSDVQDPPAPRDRT